MVVINTDLSAGGESHANLLSFSLLDNHPWRNKDKPGQAEVSSVNFFTEARMEQDITVEQDEDEEDEDTLKRRKKPKINVYEFFNDMRELGKRPLDDEPVKI